MDMKKDVGTKEYWIKNDLNRNMHVRVITPDNYNKNTMHVVFHEHGRSGSMGYPHNQVVAEAYLEKSYRVIMLDATNSQNNQSEGTLEEFTVPRHGLDLVNTINWAKNENLCKKHFAFAAHSFGGFSAFDIVGSELVEGATHIFAYAPVTDGPKQIQARYDYTPTVVEKWKKQGYIVEPSDEEEDQARLTWKQFQQWQKHSIFPVVDNIKIPVALVAGERDPCVPKNHVLAMEDALPNCIDFTVIKGASHDFKG